MRNTHSKFIDKILKEVWSKIDIKLVEGIYTEDFLKSLYETLSEYVDEDFAYEFLQEIEKSFKSGITISVLSEMYSCTSSTITRNLKKNLGESKFKEFLNKIKLLKNKTKTIENQNID